MRPGRPKERLVLESYECRKLKNWASHPKNPQRLTVRARIILHAAEGLTNQQVARILQIHAGTVGKWRTRFCNHRLAGLMDEPRPGAPRKITDARVEAVVTRALEMARPGATHVSTRAMAKALALSQSTIVRIWRAIGLQPHRTETRKSSTNSVLAEKVRDDCEIEYESRGEGDDAVRG